MNIIKYTKSKIVNLMPKWLKVALYKIWRFYWCSKTKLLPSKYYVAPYSKDKIIYAIKIGFSEHGRPLYRIFRRL